MNILICLLLFLDEHFSVKLSNLKIKDNQGRLTPGAFDKSVQLVEPSTAIVMIIDDDHSGMFVFDTDEAVVVEADHFIEVKILRTSGARGRVRVPYTTQDETAINERDYISSSGDIIFENNENEYVLVLNAMENICESIRVLRQLGKITEKRISSCSLLLLQAFLFFFVVCFIPNENSTCTFGKYYVNRNGVVRTSID